MAPTSSESLPRRETHKEWFHTNTWHSLEGWRQEPMPEVVSGRRLVNLGRVLSVTPKYKYTLHASPLKHIPSSWWGGANDHQALVLVGIGRVALHPGVVTLQAKASNKTKQKQCNNNYFGVLLWWRCQWRGNRGASGADPLQLFGWGGVRNVFERPPTRGIVVC